MDGELLKDLTIPLFTGAIGYLTNWTGVWMLFYPVRFAGWRLPGLSRLAPLLPRRIQQIPGVMQGGVGWQGIIPSRAAKIGSIAVDKGIAKLGSPADFYNQLEPEAIAEHICKTASDDIREVVDRIMEREYPDTWWNTPKRVRDAVHARVQQQLDIKLMVIRRIEQNPEMANRIYLEVGRKELRFIINFGFFFGALLGVPLVFLTNALPQWWILPIGGVIIGWVTNWMALWMIFEPVEPRRIGPLRLHGLFIRRQPEVSDVYGEIIAEDIVTLRNIGDELLHGPSADRTRQMIEDAMRPAVDRAAGPTRLALQVAIGSSQYETIRESIASQAVDYTMTPLTDPEFNRRQSAAMRTLIADRMRELPHPDFSELLRSAMREDEWLLLLHGAVLGFIAGCIHLLIFGV